jgi:hypothetical protein
MLQVIRGKMYLKMEGQFDEGRRMTNEDAHHPIPCPPPSPLFLPYLQISIFAKSLNFSNLRQDTIHFNTRLTPLLSA